ncbi:MAG TPA: formate--tetrahydrofolate ligase [Bacteroidales bacterium]|nr:formate--tetrahydrofolate ligase [Bacteroidales bacterium]HOH22824.1 formate--tetrahydrofolate ligase [Bacteroidales bacterium]HPZ03882.1 formate--tetrahydrofolate ligase [Bacteroidales bacterium]HQB75445.1 formate--tetrahydrofolate ligase [Bacteroidales bacterium]
MKSDIEIAKAANMLPIRAIAANLNIDQDLVEKFGRYKAKLPLSLIDEEKVKKSKLILVTAITPTPAGEGKTTTSIGLAQGMNKLGHKTMVVLREPSLGPVFGVKGGAAGGGYAQVIPMEDINLHFTGDLAAIERAHNLLAALIDNNLQSKTRKLNLDPRTVKWKRVMDMNERALRDIVIGLGGTSQGVPRETGFDITAASEIMAILCLSESIEDLKNKLGNIFIGYTYDKKPIFARDLNAQGAMAALLRDAIKPNLVQTLENTPALIHGGPFANIAQGTNSIIATKMGLSLSDYVVTEAGFASELGAEKFFDIKSQYGGLTPHATVIVATIRALKYHGGVDLKSLSTSNPEAVREGLQNLDKHIENILHFNIKPVVALNKFATDSEEEIAVLTNHLNDLGIQFAVNDAWAKGGEGALDLAKVVVEAAQSCSTCFRPLYEFDWTIEKKIHKIATELYGAVDVEYSLKARKDLKTIADLNLENLPVCIAKTQKSLSDNPRLLNRPHGFVVNIREIEIASGAGFVIPIASDIMRMPGLPEVPSAENIDIDNDGNITGLF